ncbi:peptidylprolyl isomerase [Aliarcobacter trophiarum LMG 25534]|uniref:Peptidyl-prolyl cis-trans isomerase n=1 Tax=Aliarcobacter trophiarum LMG 25534 TaxID=1032241 RepID=A0AAD0QIA9_9BACT|nr:peptidylprolyl isomerase [Aliarcobacter trophiarum]AXK48299.1 FKBP-type peptidyl-prolyl cis-trans isomerase [Aliarcobacter trophiarum LMG 25534]RXI28575.1 peptidylprolyl isomerase [Aliarcobacter trophiarum]RXJ93025.1 peptidylprolyl isomerase [Aliarcobacter trophiarum LMG 25534]
MSNKVIGIEYTLKDAKTGEQLDTNVGQAPLEFVSGKGQIIKGLEDKLVTMSANEEADVLVEAKDGYGEYNQEAIQTLPKEQFAGIELVEGMSLYGQGEHGETIQVVVKSFDDANVTIDYNHPMAGKTLMFTVAILSLRDATEEEVQSGVVGGFAAMGGGCCGSSSGGGHGGCGCASGNDEHDHDHGHSHGGGCGTGGGHGGCGCH